MERLIHDLCYAIRGLGKHFGFAVVATLSLGLGVGLNTAIFSIIESVLVRPLPFYEPQRLYEIWAVSKDEGPDHIGSSGPEFRDYKEQSRTLEHVASVLPHFTITWTGQGEPRTLQCTAVSSDFFPMLGLKPVLGRFYLPEEYYVDGVQVLVSYRFWKQQLNGDPSAVGRVLNVDGTAQTIIGIVPPLPDLFPDTEIWAKVVPSFHWMQVRGNRFLTVIARLKPGRRWWYPSRWMVPRARFGPHRYASTKPYAGGIGALDSPAPEIQPVRFRLSGANISPCPSDVHQPDSEYASIRWAGHGGFHPRV